jgi:hypothetical protein
MGEAMLQRARCRYRRTRSRSPNPLAMNDPRDPAWTETWRELGQLAWAILLLDLVAIGLGALAARAMGDFARKVGVGLAVFLTVCFLVLIGSNLVIASLFWWWRTRRRARTGEPNLKTPSGSG